MAALRVRCQLSWPGRRRGRICLVLFGVHLSKPSAASAAIGRPIGVIVRQPRFITAVVCAAVSYLLMSFLMTAAPLAMGLCGLSQESADLGLQWHVIAM